MQVLIEGITHRGEGVARVDGKAVFIPLAIPGETAEIEIIQNRSRFMRGVLLQTLEPSADRVDPVCPHFPTCGGCHFQHISYLRQLQLKQQIVQDNLQRIGRIETEVLPVWPSPQPWNYRNKVTWHVRNQEIGYFQEGSNHLLSICTCKIICEPLQKITAVIRDLMGHLPANETGEIILRHSWATGQSLLVISGFNKFPPSWELLQSVCENAVLIKENQINILWGSDHLQERLGQIDFELSPTSFFQVNHQQAERIIQYLQQELPLNNDKSLLDLYCGVGAISLNLAFLTGQVTGIEEFPPAVEDARINAQQNNIDNVQFYTGACEEILPQLSDHYDLIVLDPPRVGCYPDVIEAVARQQPQQIAYVSCNPSTLARDMACLQESGYCPTIIQPIDMFPQTYHVEVVTLLTRSNATQ